MARDGRPTSIFARRPGASISRAALVVLMVLLPSGLFRALAYEVIDYVTYQPDGCEFSVLFPDTPKTEVERGDAHIRAVATFQSGSDFMEASCTIFDKFSSLDIPDDTLRLWGWTYANRAGIKFPDISVDATPAGRRVTIRGAALNGNKAIIHWVHAYYGEKSRMSLYVSGPSDNFPSKPIRHFLDSIQRAAVPDKKAGN